LPILGLFAAAAFRLMPSVNRVLTAVQSLRFGTPVVETLHSELSLAEGMEQRRKSRATPLADSIELREVSFAYPGASGNALERLSLLIRRGESVGFIGPSGAGKSTLVDVILGLLEPSAGAVLVDGVDIHAAARHWQDQIGYVPQTIYLTDDSLAHNVALGIPADLIDHAAVWRAIRAAQLEDFVGSLPEGLETMVGEHGVRISGGQRQRIGIARALYHDPAVLVLDEATSSLDTATEHEVMEAVRALHGLKTSIIVAHRLSTVEHCDHLYRLEGGRIIQEGRYAFVGRNDGQKAHSQR
jgi:ABC-type multidrug transport system fused ATPase/permease subunit